MVQVRQGEQSLCLLSWSSFGPNIPNSFPNNSNHSGSKNEHTSAASEAVGAGGNNHNGTGSAG